MRTCGDCQACCKIMPISEIGKPSNTRCSKQKFGVGCKVYGTQAQPPSCKRWSCWWLLSPEFNLPRPDRAGYIVDPMQDFVVIGEDVHAGKRVPALQIWADPNRPDAWRGAIEWIKKALAFKGEAVSVIRFNEREAVVLVPPSLSDTGEWKEVDSRIMKPVTAEALRIKSIVEAVENAIKGEEA